MTLPNKQRRGVLSYLQRPAFWITVVAYVALTFAEWGFFSSPLFRIFVEQNQNGFLRGYFSDVAGYDVVGAVAQELRGQIVLVLEGVALLLAIVLLVLRKFEAVALGILAVILTYLAIAFCLALLFLMLVRRGY
jgi:hypothetical protein